VWLIVENVTRKILKKLDQFRDDYISGQKISDSLGVTRTTVWKHIQKLKEKGFKIESISNRGYRLKASPERLIPETILLGLDTDKLVTDIYYYKSVGSTNKKARQLANTEEVEDGTLVIAEEQRKGSGRRGRSWFSPPETGLWFSLLLKPDFAPEKAPFLTIIASLAVHRALNEKGFSPNLKWPNDILINKQKVCGILSELSAELDYIKYAVVGIGINVNQQSFPEEIREIATSLCQLKNDSINRKELLQSILQYFEKYYTKLLEGNEESLLEEWKGKLRILGRCIEITSSGKEYKGKVVDISDKGELILKTNEGDIRSFWAGDTSLNL
jgi:BirA family biotin operon repressor/biotin-[acetyl-CoA-carboxylase] ligase